MCCKYVRIGGIATVDRLPQLQLQIEKSFYLIYDWEEFTQVIILSETIVDMPSTLLTDYW